MPKPKPNSKSERSQQTTPNTTICGVCPRPRHCHPFVGLTQQPPQTSTSTKALKQRLLGTFNLSKWEWAARLLHTRPLGDSKPSALMDEMLALLGNHAPCLLFEQLFLERLPEDIRVQLVDAEIKDHQELADALWAARDPEVSANTIQSRSANPHKQPTLPRQHRANFVSTIESLEKQLRNANSHALGQEMSRPVRRIVFCLFGIDTQDVISL